jgi:hypothetical protein
MAKDAVNDRGHEGGALPSLVTLAGPNSMKGDGTISTPVTISTSSTILGLRHIHTCNCSRIQQNACIIRVARNMRVLGISELPVSWVVGHGSWWIYGLNLGVGREEACSGYIRAPTQYVLFFGQMQTD